MRLVAGSLTTKVTGDELDAVRTASERRERAGEAFLGLFQVDDQERDALAGEGEMQGGVAVD